MFERSLQSLTTLARHRRPVAVAVLLVLAVVGIGLYFRVAGFRDVFCSQPDELAEVMPGLRLHGLKFFNLRDGPRENFFKSAFYSQHGLGDTGFYYVASAALSLVRMPVSEKNLFLAATVTNLLLMLFGAVFAIRVARSPVMAATFVALVAVSPFYVLVSQTGWGRLTFVPALQLAVLLAQWWSQHSRSFWPTALFCGLAFFLAMTDGFFFVAVMVCFAIVSREGSLVSRLRQAVHDRTLWAGLASFGAGFSVSLAVAIYATTRGTNLTMLRYVLLRGGHGGLVPDWEVIRAWLAAVDWYFPVKGGWLVVLVAGGLALFRRFHNPVAWTFGFWWLLVSLGVIRYAMGTQWQSGHAGAGWINAYSLALPSYLLVAWLASELFPRDLRWCLVAILTLGMASQVYGGEGIMSFRKGEERRLANCRVVKAAGYYVREHGDSTSYVFHLTNDNSLGHVGEYYYGLSYGRNAHTGEPNRLLDFGKDTIRTQSRPEAYYHTYGVSAFDYYIEFLTNPDDAFAASVASQLLADGASVVFVVEQDGKPIGRVLSFRAAPQAVMEYSKAAALWDRKYARLGRLLQQPFAGTAYHFGYQWLEIRSGPHSSPP